MIPPLPLYPFLPPAPTSFVSNNCPYPWKVSKGEKKVRLFSHESKVHNLNDHLNCASEWSFEWRYFRQCVRKFILRCVIWIAKLPYDSNALTSKLWFGGGAMWPSNHFRLYTACCISTEAQETWAPCMFDWQVTQTRSTHLLGPRWNARPQIRSLVCIHTA